MVDRLILDLVAKIDGASSNADLQKFLANAQRVLSKPIKLNIQLGQSAQVLARITKLTKSLNDVNAAAKRSVPALRSVSVQLGGISTQASRASIGLNKFSLSTKKVDTALVRSSIAAKTAASGMEQFGRQAAISIRRYAGFVIASRVVFGFAQTLDNALRSAIQFNRELLKVGQVLDIPISGLGSLSRTLNELSVDFAAPADELIKAARIFAQAGFSLRETEEAIRALAPTTLAPTFGSLDQTASGALAVLKQFNIETSELTAVFDNLNEVAAKFPVEVTDILTAVTRAGAVFASSDGVTDGLKDSRQALAEFVALFTTVRATTRQSAERISTGLRTIFTRIQRPLILEQLRELNIELTNTDTGAFVGQLEAIRRLGEGLSGLDSNNPRFIEILQDIAGLRQIEKLLPLVQQTALTQRALQTGLASTGSVARDTAQAMDNLAVQFEQVVQQVGVLAREVVSSDTFDILAKSALNFSSALIQVLRALEPILPILAAVGAFRFARGAATFGKGAFQNLAGAGRSDGGRVGFATGGEVKTLLTPGERVFSPRAVNREGITALNKLNDQGNSSRIKSFAGSFVVPGRGSTDSVPMDLPPGSFVVKKRNALADRAEFGSGGSVRRRRRRLFQDGGRVRLQTGGSSGELELISAEEVKAIEKRLAEFNKRNPSTQTKLSSISKNIKELESQEQTLERSKKFATPAGQQRLSADIESTRKRIAELNREFADLNKTIQKTTKDVADANKANKQSSAQKPGSRRPTDQDLKTGGRVDFIERELTRLKAAQQKFNRPTPAFVDIQRRIKELEKELFNLGKTTQKTTKDVADANKANKQSSAQKPGSRRPTDQDLKTGKFISRAEGTRQRKGQTRQENITAGVIARARKSGSTEIDAAFNADLDEQIRQRNITAGILASARRGGGIPSSITERRAREEAARLAEQRTTRGVIARARVAGAGAVNEAAAQAPAETIRQANITAGILARATRSDTGTRDRIADARAIEQRTTDAIIRRATITDINRANRVRREAGGERATAARTTAGIISRSAATDAGRALRLETEASKKLAREKNITAGVLARARVSDAGSANRLATARAEALRVTNNVIAQARRGDSGFRGRARRFGQQNLPTFAGVGGRLRRLRLPQISQGALIAGSIGASLLPEAQTRGGAATVAGLQSGLGGAAIASLFGGPVTVAVVGFTAAIKAASDAVTEFDRDLIDAKIGEAARNLAFIVKDNPQNIAAVNSTVNKLVNDTGLNRPFSADPGDLFRDSIQRAGLTSTVLASTEEIVRGFGTLLASTLGLGGTPTIDAEGRLSGSGAGITAGNRLVEEQQLGRVQDIRDRVAPLVKVTTDSVEQFLKTNAEELAKGGDARQAILDQIPINILKLIGVGLGAPGNDPGQLFRNAVPAARDWVNEVADGAAGVNKLNKEFASLTTLTSLTNSAFSQFNTDLQNATSDFQRLPEAISDIISPGTNIPRLTRNANAAQLGAFAGNPGAQQLLGQARIVQNSRNAVSSLLESGINAGLARGDIITNIRKALKTANFDALPKAIRAPLDDALNEFGGELGAFNFDLSTFGAQTEGAFNAFINTFNDGSQKIGAALTERIKVESEIVGLNVQNLNAQQSFRDRIRAARGDTGFSLGRVLQDRTANLGVLSPGGPARGLLETRAAAAIINRRTALSQVRENILAAPSPDQKALADNTRRLQENSNQLNLLATDTKALTSIQQQLTSIQQARSQALGFATRFTSATPEQRREIIRADNDFDAFLSGARLSAPAVARINREITPNLSPTILDEINATRGDRIAGGRFTNLENFQQRLNVSGGLNDVLPRGTAVIGAIARLGQSQPGALPEEKKLIDELKILEGQRAFANAALVANLDAQITRIDEQLKLNTAQFITTVDAAIAKSTGIAQLGRIAESLGTVPEDIKITFPAPVEVNHNGTVELSQNSQQAVANRLIESIDAGLIAIRNVRNAGDTP